MKASDILGFSDLRTKVVHVDQWDCDLTIRELGLDEGLRLFAFVSDDKITLSGEDIAHVIAWSVVDDNGERVFSDEDIPALAKKNRDAMIFLYQEIASLSGDDTEKN